MSDGQAENEPLDEPAEDIDPQETSEWLESLDAVISHGGGERARFLLDRLLDHGRSLGVQPPFSANTPYVNTIHVSKEPEYPGDLEIERQIAAIIRWNAMAMVVQANRSFEGIGGHISSFASAATLYEVGFHHYFRSGEAGDGPSDMIYFQGHASPGVYARAFLEGRLTANQLHNFRRELAPGGGLSSYPHPWCMPDFWEFPTVSMGIASISAIYQARFNRYLQNRGIGNSKDARVWAFLGDGEMDEPESLGAITLASREKLDNLTFVINCNLQRLDGPVRGNGKVIQELEAAFRGAGWNVIKVLWGNNWDPLLASEHGGLLARRMMEAIDGEYQRYKASDGAYVREHFFGKYPELLSLVEHMSDDEVWRLRRGGHDARKVNASYAAAVAHKGAPTVILAKTIKGYGLGEAAQGLNVTHQQKKLKEDQLREFRDRFEIPISDKDFAEAPFYKPDPKSELVDYLHERRRALGGYIPSRKPSAKRLEVPGEELFKEFHPGSGERQASTTMVFVQMLARLMSHEGIGRNIVPIVPDEARTFGLDALFRKHGIYAHGGQLYEPVDSNVYLYYREAQDGQILEEGITEAGSMASFSAAGTAYASHGVHMIPFFMFYSMFGFQRVGDSIWAAADMRARGFLIGATAGRTTLAGEGLQHQDGHSLLHASTVPNCISYDPAYAYEIAVIVQEGLRRMYADDEDVFYYLCLENDNYRHPPMPPGCAEGILRGMHKVSPALDVESKARIHLFGSGAILPGALEAQELLAGHFDVGADVWSVTSYTELGRDARQTERWNMRHPGRKARVPYLLQQLDGEDWPIVAVSDYVRTLPDQLSPWLGSRMCTLGTDGFGRSDTREALREHFEVDARSIAFAAVYSLVSDGKLPKSALKKAASRFEVDPDKAQAW
jgi:pyruvate dehydrogenase E1 component